MRRRTNAESHSPRAAAVHPARNSCEPATSRHVRARMLTIARHPAPFATRAMLASSRLTSVAVPAFSTASTASTSVCPEAAHTNRPSSHAARNSAGEIPRRSAPGSRTRSGLGRRCSGGRFYASMRRAESAVRALCVCAALQRPPCFGEGAMSNRRLAFVGPGAPAPHPGWPAPRWGASRSC